MQPQLSAAALLRGKASRQYSDCRHVIDSAGFVTTILICKVCMPCQELVAYVQLACFFDARLGMDGAVL